MNRIYYKSRLYVLWDDNTWTTEDVSVRVDSVFEYNDMDDASMEEITIEQFIANRGGIDDDFENAFLCSYHSVEA